MAAEPGEEKGTPAPRTPRSVINEAIRETAAFNSLIFVGLIIFGSTGVVAILAGVIRGDAWIGGIGTVPAVLCWPALKYAIMIRQQNIALRMLELALNNVQTADQALKAIHQAFGFHFGRPEGKPDVGNPKSTTTAPRSSSEDR